MVHNKLRSHVLVLLGIGALLQVRATGPTSAQEAQKPAMHGGIAYGNIRLSGYRKITAGLAGIHVVGADTIFEFRETGRRLHRLHADDIHVSTTGNGVSGELSGNIHYTLLQLPNNSKLVDGTADRAVYKQFDAKQADTKQVDPKQAAMVTLFQAHTSLFRDDKEIATLDAGQVVANQQDDTVTGTGAVHITARIEGHRAEVTADKIIWNQRANTVEASGKAHISYTGPDKKDGVADSDRIKIDMKNLEFEIE
jgi:lipopolysaccharide export system protein LptA